MKQFFTHSMTMVFRCVDSYFEGILNGFPILLFLFSLFVTSTRGTYSIVATDSTTLQVGGAGVTCLNAGYDSYKSLYHSSPGKSVLHTQGWLLKPNIKHHAKIIQTANDMMKEGQSPKAVL